MGPILPLVSAGAFEPNDIQAMSLAYENICDALHINGDIRARETIAVKSSSLPGAANVAPRSCATGCWRRRTAALRVLNAALRRRLGPAAARAE